MGEEKSDVHGWKERLSKSYRLVVYQDEDFQEVRSFNLTIGLLYAMLSGMFIIVAVVLTSLIIFTPIKKFIPGYADIEVNQKFIDLTEEVASLSSQITAQQTYINALQNIVKSPEEVTVSSISSHADHPLDKGGPILNAEPAEFKTSFQNNPSDSRIYNALSENRIIKPVDGIISSDFDPQLKHFGVDILAPKDTPVRAMMDGFVFLSSWDLETGYTLGIQHEENILSFYKHNSVLLKEKGTFVSAGEAVAIIGNTGTLSNGPHLHFEMWHNGKPVNPIDFVNFN